MQIDSPVATRSNSARVWLRRSREATSSRTGPSRQPHAAASRGPSRSRRIAAVAGIAGQPVRGVRHLLASAHGELGPAHSLVSRRRGVQRLLGAMHQPCRALGGVVVGKDACDVFSHARTVSRGCDNERCAAREQSPDVALPRLRRAPRSRGTAAALYAAVNALRNEAFAFAKFYKPHGATSAEACRYAICTASVSRCGVSAFTVRSVRPSLRLPRC